MSKAMWLRLVLPLALLAGAFVYLERVLPPTGLYLNLATEFIGIIVTVAYVDWVLKAHERRRWKGTATRINDSLRTLSNATISGIRGAFGIDADIIDGWVVQSGDQKRINAEVRRIGIKVLGPVARHRLDHLDVEGWRRLGKHLQGTWREAERLLDRFGNRLEPEDMELLMDLQRELNAATVFWLTFPDIAGVPDDKLPRTNSDTVELKSSFYDQTAVAIRKVISIADALGARSSLSV